jgi:hypothetical protein
VKKYNGISKGGELLMVDSKAVWPDFFPIQCPPTDARKEVAEVYRVVEHDPINNKDFLPHIILFPNNNYGVNQCKACGLSVYRLKEDCVNVMKAIPRLRKAGKVAHGIIPQEGGVIKNTPKNGDSHVTWWAYCDIDPGAYFTVMEDEKCG